MKRAFVARIAVLAVAAGTIAAAQQAGPGQPAGLKGPYLGQAVPGTTPVVFAPGLVSGTGAKASACTFSPDGKEFYFTRGNERIMVSRLTDQGWTVPEAFALTAAYRAVEPHVTLDNKRLYWNWHHPSHPGGLAIYVAERAAAGWSAPAFAGEGMFTSSSRDGDLFVTHLGRESDYVSRVVLEGPRFAGYEDLKGPIEKIRTRSASVAHPCVAPDGSYIIFDIDGGPHLFVSFRQADGTWGEPIDLSAHGLDVKAGIASLTPDGKYLFFGLGNDLYWVSAKLVEDLRPKGR
jgi:hypothetical protein